MFIIAHQLFDDNEVTLRPKKSFNKFNYLNQLLIT